MNLRTRMPVSLRFVAILLGSLGLVALTAPLAHAGGFGGTVSVNDVSLNEGNGGTTTFTFTVTATEPVDGNVVVNYNTTDGSAKAPGDYTAEASTTTIDDGETTATIAIDVGADLSAEPNETFTVSLTSTTQGTVDDGTGLGMILNDDGTPPSLSVADQSFSEAPSEDENVPVTLSAVSSQDVTFTVTTSNGTAVEGPLPGATGSQSDDFDGYDGTGDTFTILAGNTSVNVPVKVWDAASDEDTESFTFAISAPDNAVLGDSSATITITDTDPSPRSRSAT